MVCEAYMICFEKTTFSKGRMYFFCFDVTAHGIPHRGASKHYIMQEESTREAASFSNRGLLHINQREKKRNQRERSPESHLFSKKSVNGAARFSRRIRRLNRASGGGLCLQVRLKMRKEISIKRDVILFIFFFKFLTLQYLLSLSFKHMKHICRLKRTNSKQRLFIQK